MDTLHTLLDAATMLEDVAAPPKLVPATTKVAVCAAREVLKAQRAEMIAELAVMERQVLPEAWKCFKAALPPSTVDGLVGVIADLHARFMRAAQDARQHHASHTGAHVEVLKHIRKVVREWIKALHLCADRAAPYLQPIDLKGLLHTALVMINIRAKAFAKSDACRCKGRTWFIILWDCTAHDAAKAVGRSRPQCLQHLMMSAARGRA